MSNDREADSMYQHYIDQLIVEQFGGGDTSREEAYWDEAVEGRALDKWRGFE